MAMANRQGAKSADPTVGTRPEDQGPEKGDAIDIPQWPARYVKKTYVGGGAYGKVWLAEDTEQQKKQVAVKWISNFARDPLCGKRTLREIKLLGSLRHENLMTLHDLPAIPSLEFSDIFIVMPYMTMDLHKVIHSQMNLSKSHVEAFVCQILRGLKYLHSAGVWHRDLKPGNILVNKDCTLKIADFGLARGHTDEKDSLFSEYVVTRWYRSPEIMLEARYDEAVDMWSVGCIHGELLLREPLFPGKDTMQMLKLIIAALGFDHERDLAWVPSSNSEAAPTDSRSRLTRLNPEEGPLKLLIASLKPDDIKKVPLEEQLKEKHPGITEACLAFIHQLLVFNPHNRISAVDALDHEYLRHLHDPEGEKIAPKKFPWDFDNFEPKKRALQDRVYAECARLHPEIVQRDYEQLKARGLVDGSEGSRRSSAQNGSTSRSTAGASDRERASQRPANPGAKDAAATQQASQPTSGYPAAGS